MGCFDSVRNDDDEELSSCPRSSDAIEGETNVTCHEAADVAWTPAQVRVALAVQIDGALLVGDTPDRATVTTDACNIVVSALLAKEGSKEGSNAMRSTELREFKANLALIKDCIFNYCPKRDFCLYAWQVLDNFFGEAERKAVGA